MIRLFAAVLTLTALPATADPLSGCLYRYTVTAPMTLDADTVRGHGSRPSVRLTGENDTPMDTPEITRPGCDSEARQGHAAERLMRDTLRQNGGGTVCVIGFGDGGIGRDLGVLYVDDGEQSVDVMGLLRCEGLARQSRNYDWCEEAQ